MPHDANGELVEAGDEVILRCKVVRVYEVDDYCNIDLDTVHFMPPYTESTRLSMVNASR